MSGEPRRDSSWWGWGDPSISPDLDGPAIETLEERVGRLEPAPLEVAIEDFELPPAEPLPQPVIDAAGADSVFTSVEDRVRHATGCGYVDLARLRSGKLEQAPDVHRMTAHMHDDDGLGLRCDGGHDRFGRCVQRHRIDIHEDRGCAQVDGHLGARRERPRPPCQYQCAPAAGPGH